MFTIYFQVYVLITFPIWRVCWTPFIAVI